MNPGLLHYWQILYHLSHQGSSGSGTYHKYYKIQRKIIVFFIKLTTWHKSVFFYPKHIWLHIPCYHLCMTRILQKCFWREVIGCYLFSLSIRKILSWILTIKFIGSCGDTRSLSIKVSTSLLSIILYFFFVIQFSSVQSLSRVWLFATPWIAARQASLSITNSRSSHRLTSIE